MPFSILPSRGITLKLSTAGKLKTSFLRRLHVRDRSSSSDDPNFREFSQSGRELDSKPTNLSRLPYDVLVVILYFLHFDDFASARLVCRSLHEASETLELWHNLAFQMQAASIALVLDDFTHPRTLPLPSLKSVVCQSAFLHRNWSGASLPSSARLSGSSAPRILKAKSKHTYLGMSIVEFLPVAAAFVTDDYFVMPSEDHLVCLDIQRCLRLEEYALELRKPLISLHIDLETRDAFAVVVGRDADRKLNLHVVLIKLPSFPDMKREDLPLLQPKEQPQPTDQERPKIFERIRALEIPANWVVITLLANAATRTICLLVFTHPAPQSLKLFTIFDWDDMESSCVVDTGFYLEAPFHRKTTHIRFAGDMSDVVAVKEDEAGWEQRRFSIAAMKAISNSFASLPLTLPASSPSPLISTPLSHITPTRLKLKHPPFYTHLVPYPSVFFPLALPPEPEGFHVGRSLYWTHLHCYHTYPGVPARFSHAYLYKRRKVSDGMAPGEAEKETYFIAQHYSSEEGPEGCVPADRDAGTEALDGADHAAEDGGEEGRKKKRFILEMRNPVTVRYDESLTVPLMGMSFNHMVWIEQEKGYGKTVYKMQFVKFPDPSTRPSSSLSSATSLTPSPSSLPLSPCSSSLSMSSFSPEFDSHAGSMNIEPYRGSSDGNERSQNQDFKIETLTDIDPEVAEMAYQILLEPTMAAIMITTRTNYFYRYQYA